MKRSYSYFIVKPDGIRYLDEILNDLEGKFQEIKYYAVDDFESLIKKLYHKHYEKKGSDFAKSYASYLYSTVLLLLFYRNVSPHLPQNSPAYGKTLL